MRSFRKFTRLKKVGKTYIFFIIKNGYYPDFVRWCTAHPSVLNRSQNLRAYLYLRHKDLLGLFYGAYEALFLNDFDLKEVCRIARTEWL